jgi:putative redox protein
MAVTARSLENYQVEIRAGTHTFVSDEPIGIGDDAGPSPFNLLLSGLASCTIITLRMYAERKNWPLEGVEASLEIQSSEDRDEQGNKHRTSRIHNRMTFHGPLSDEQIRRLADISTRCPVHLTLLGDISITHSITNLES